MRRYPEAIAGMEKPVNLDPLSLEINHFLALSYEISGDYERALRQYHRATYISQGVTFYRCS